MASLQLRNDSYSCIFYFHGRRHWITLGKVAEQEAEAFAGKVEYVLMRIRQRLIQLPPGTKIEDFILNDGKDEPVVVQSDLSSLQDLRDRYIGALSNGAVESNSLDTTKLHLQHFIKTLGPSFPVPKLAAADLQRHIDKRAKEKGKRHRLLSPATMRKEMASFRAAWNWAVHMGMLAGTFPYRGLIYPKGTEKPPFMTWDEIERKTTSPMTEADKAELWDCLYLDKKQIGELLVYVNQHGTQPWVYPLLCTAAYTGARRSELLRILVTDLNFKSDTILIREKKRSSSQRTTRTITLTSFLKAVLEKWLKVHPGGPFLFAPDSEIYRSKKRSRTTGHRGNKTRATTLKGRTHTVSNRGRQPLGAITKDEVYDHVKRTLAGGRWTVLRGIHVFRHSFISCLAAAGVDQRMIDDLVGHQTDEQRRRYRHLAPDLKQKTLDRVFN